MHTRKLYNFLMLKRASDGFQPWHGVRAWPWHSPVGGLTVVANSLSLTITVPANVLLPQLRLFQPNTPVLGQLFSSRGPLHLLLTSLSICIGLRIHDIQPPLWTAMLSTFFPSFPRPLLGIRPSFFLPLLPSPFPMVPLWWYSLLLVTSC